MKKKHIGFRPLWGLSISIQEKTYERIVTSVSVPYGDQAFLYPCLLFMLLLFQVSVPYGDQAFLYSQDGKYTQGDLMSFRPLWGSSISIR